jgi:hypothetical protein
MGPWAIAIIVSASVLGLFLADMAWRGFLDDVGTRAGFRCTQCRQFARVPLPASRHCWHCRRSGVARAAASVVRHSHS